MPPGTVDLPRARRALAELDRLAAEHPEAFRLSAGEWERVLSEDTNMTKSEAGPSQMTAFRLPVEMVKRIDAHADRLAKLTGLKVSRADVVKMLLARALDGAERDAAELEKRRKVKR